MPKKAKELGPLAVKQLAKPGAHAVGGVAGLMLKISSAGARSWILRARMGGLKVRDMGLGGFPDVPLAEAREKARAARSKISEGDDPIRERELARSTLAAATARAKTFDQCVEAYIKNKSKEWTNDKHAKQWQSTLDRYASPIFGKALVHDIDLTQVLAVLEPIWNEKTTTANRLRGRIETILDFAAVKRYRTGENPARWRGHLDQLLGRPKKIHKITHHEAIHFKQANSFLLELRLVEGTAARALELLLLTVNRTKPVLGARWSEFDWNDNVWTVPGTRMKSKKVHRVPLSTQAISTIEALPRFEGCDFLFPGRDKLKPMSNMAMLQVMRRMGLTAVPHGLRSTFKDWASEVSHYPSEISEMALAHVIEDPTEAAYRRGDLLQKRHQMMQDWADYCEKDPSEKPVVHFVNGEMKMLPQ